MEKMQTGGRMPYNTISVTEEGSVAVCTLTAAEKLNPLDVETGKELLEALRVIGDRDDIRALIITGTGKAFSAGGDVKGMLKSIEDGVPDAFMDDLTRSLYAISILLREMPKPVVAAVNGVAVGAGMNLALSCDFIIAAEKAKFSQGFIKLALIPGFGGTHMLIHQLPWQKAAEIAMLGDMIGAEEMKDLGFVNKVVPEDRLPAEAMELARRLAEGPTLSFARTKRLFLDAMGSSFRDHLEHERDVQVQSTLTGDYETGVRAMVDRTTPKFSGK